ncbi:hypothetical protein [Chloroflexus sp.]|uniref:hypothetical protein n=1 Tax=Chloroflexus sp. TaxID=1904827 RepID=UPI002619F578|nr:hypothetical protein [uncultured Chloroflexus sp.]
MKKILLILDFSGTLSLEAVRFGAPARLEAALRDAGLWTLGIDVARYWDEVVGPTWIEGSSTQIGLKGLLARWLEARGVAATLAARRAARFVQSYMAASEIDPAWQRLFAALRADPRAITLIATDHYVEATRQIARQMAKLGWAALSLQLRNGRIARRRRNALVAPPMALIANSAELGVAKAEPLFWQRVQAGLRAAPDRIVVVDDFGASEQADDSYADPARVERRRRQTIAALEQTFAAPVSTVWFTLARPVAQTIDEILALVADADGVSRQNN